MNKSKFRDIGMFALLIAIFLMTFDKSDMPVSKEIMMWILYFVGFVSMIFGNQKGDEK